MKKFFRQHRLLCILLPVVLFLTVAVLIGVWQVNRAKQVRSFVEEGNRYLSDLNYDQASICYQQALDLDKYNKDASLGMAECYEVGGQDVYAENIYRTLLDRDPGEEDIYPLLADLLIRGGKNEEAKAVMAEAVSHIDPEDNADIAAWYTLTHPQTPVYDYESGDYGDRIMVTITADPADTIYYTTDGTDPTMESKVYTDTSPLVMYNGVNTVRAAAYNTSGFCSDISEGIFNILLEEVVIRVADPVMENIIRTQLELSWDEDIHNDDIAQITSLHIIGNAYQSKTPPVSVTYHPGGTHVTVGYGTYTSDYERQYCEGNLVSLSDTVHMPFLSTLEIAYQPNLDVNTVVGATSIRNLSLIGCSLTAEDAALLGGMTQLTSLCLGWNDIDSVAALSALTELETLSVWGNRVTDVSPLASLTKLHLLDISENAVAEITALSALGELRELWMYGNRIARIAPLASLEQLCVLMVRGNPITDGDSIRPIYPHLQRLDTDLLRLADSAAQ